MELSLDKGSSQNIFFSARATKKWCLTYIQVPDSNSTLCGNNIHFYVLLDLMRPAFQLCTCLLKQCTSHIIVAKLRL